MSGRSRNTPRAPADSTAAASAETLAEAIARLAARGLSEPEIRARLEAEGAFAELLGTPLDEAAEAALSAAFQRGRLLGRARVKEAQFESALAGRVTAQSQVLWRLGEPDGGGEDTEGTIDDPGQGVPDETAEDDGLGHGAGQRRRTRRHTRGSASPTPVAVERSIVPGRGPQGPTGASATHAGSGAP